MRGEAHPTPSGASLAEAFSFLTREPLNEGRHPFQSSGAIVRTNPDSTSSRSCTASHGTISS